MGNCLVLPEKKVIKIMRMDGEILQYQSPLTVQQVLDEFPGHAMSDDLPVITFLEPSICLSHGQLYYLLPHKKPVATVDTGAGAGTIRIKLVITKQELKVMLRKGGISPDDMLSFLKSKQSSVNEKERSAEWRPSLESIPEGHDFC